jgi:hypothetical protein
MSQHGTPLVRYMKYIPMALLALFVFKRRISGIAVFFTVIRFSEEMNKDIFDAMPGFRIEKIERIMGGRKVTIHTVRHKTLGVIDMGGRFPGIEGRLDFVAGSTKLRGRCTNHRIIGYAEGRKTDNHPESHKDGADNIPFHGFSSLF